MCVNGARWVQQEVLEKYPTAGIRVYAVWFNMFPGDSRSKWLPNLLNDSRAVHRWDETKAVGRWFAQNKSRLQPRLTPDSGSTAGEILWDSYLLYDTTARWDNVPTGLIHWGRTIMAARETLRSDIDKLFATKHGHNQSNYLTGQLK